MMVRATLLSLCMMVTGCTFSVPQAESALRWAKSLKKDKDNSAEEQPIWLASFDERGAVLRPYTTGELVVFANSDGDAVSFDGWIVRSITGFGLSKPVSISGREGVRSVVSGEVAFTTTCGAWVWRPPVWRQRCDQGSSDILLDDEGNIQKISMSLGKKVGFVTLRVAN